MAAKPRAFWFTTRNPRACSYPTVTIWLHQLGTAYLRASITAMSLWGIFFAPARSSSLSHSSQARPVARITASLPTPARRRPFAARLARVAREGGLDLGFLAGALRTLGLRTTGLAVAPLRAGLLRLAAMALPPASLQEDQLLEKMHVLLVLQ